MFIIVKFSFALIRKQQSNTTIPTTMKFSGSKPSKGLISSCVMVAKIETELILHLYQHHHMTWLLETSRDTCIEIHKLKR